MRRWIVVCLGLIWAATTGLGANDRDARDRVIGIDALDAVAIPVGTEPIKIDGVLAEEIWTRATPITEFRQRDPREGEKATHATEVRVLFDATSLYVSIRALDPEPQKVVGLLTRRDDSSPSDWVSILIDSFHDKRTAYEFGVNPAGVKFDRYWYNDTNSDRSWDAVWDAASARSSEGWRAEFRIPFSQLRFKAGETAALGFAVMRTVQHASETETWPLLARSASGFVSSFGELRGITLSGTGKKLEIVPYALSELTTRPVAPGDPLQKSPDPSLSAGVDVKYRVAPGMTLTATVNPDFGQVEADPAVVNLGAFETFFPERRPFFVEGSGNFAFNVDCNDGDCTGLFYSRRIGRQPHRYLGAPDGGFSAQPSNTTILGAAKLTGRVGKFSVGALNAITAREDARIVTSPGAAASFSPVEPASSYTVGRASREFTNNSRLSFMMTSTNRKLMDELRSLPSSAVTGGVDGDWRLGNGVYSLKGLWAGSTVQGTPEAISAIQLSNVHSYQRPDAQHVSFDPTRTSIGGHAGSASFNKISGQTTRFSSNFGYKSPGFEINDLGYQQRADELSMSNWYQIRSDKPGKHVRNKNINFNQWAGWNFDGDRRSLGTNINSHWTFTNNLGFGSGFNINTEGFADRISRGGPGALVPGNINQWGYFDSDGRKRVSASFFGSWANNLNGSWRWSVEPSVNWRPSTALQLNLGIDYSRNLDETQWVNNLLDAGTTHYVFGEIDQTTVGISTRLNYTIRPTLTLQIYAQPYVSSGAYAGFKELVDGRADRYEDRYAPYAYGGNPNFNYLSFRTTNVLRWEYRPGSALFVVWQQGRESVTPYGDFQLGRDVGGAFDAPATNVVLVKFTRWFNF